MSTRRGRAVGASVAVCVALALAACSAPATPRRAVDSGVSQQVRDAMKDGKVTYDEYRDGYERYAACMRDAGYPLVEKGKDRWSLFDYAVPSAAVDKGVDKKCYDREFGQLDDAWQISHADDSESADFLRKCLTQAGIAPKKTMEQLSQQIDENHIDLVACLEKG